MEDTTTLEACLDCYYPYHEGETLTLPGDVTGITDGIFPEQHNTNCEAYELSDDDGNYYATGKDCDCEVVEFACSWCDFCGSSSCGERRLMTGWID